MHSFSLVTVGSPHCSLKLVVAVWEKKKESGDELVKENNGVGDSWAIPFVKKQKQGPLKCS